MRQLLFAVEEEKMDFCFNDAIMRQSPLSYTEEGERCLCCEKHLTPVEGSAGRTLS